MSPRRWTTILVAAALAAASTCAGAAPLADYAFTIDRFVIQRSLNNTDALAPIFVDHFDDGNAPPSAPDFSGGGPASYLLFPGSATVGPESGGKLSLRSADAVVTTAATGDTVVFQGARLLTNADSTDTTTGLKSGHRFTVTGVFDLIPPDDAGEQFGIRLDDFAPGNANSGDDVLDLRVLKSPSTGNDIVQLLRLDFVTGTAAPVGSPFLLDPNHEQIALHLSKDDVTLDAITASFDYLDSGASSPGGTFSSTDLFSNEGFTRASFFAGDVAPVPLPPALPLLGGALAGLVAMRGRRDGGRDTPDPG